MYIMMYKYNIMYISVRCYVFVVCFVKDIEAETLARGRVSNGKIKLIK